MNVWLNSRVEIPRWAVILVSIVVFFSVFMIMTGAYYLFLISVYLSNEVYELTCGRDVLRFCSVQQGPIPVFVPVISSPYLLVGIMGLLIVLAVFLFWIVRKSSDFK